MHKWFHFGTIELKISYKMLYKWAPRYIKTGLPESAESPPLRLCFQRGIRCQYRLMIFVQNQFLAVHSDIHILRGNGFQIV